MACERKYRPMPPLATAKGAVEIRVARVEGDGYVLYSVGWNQQDDGGSPGKTMFDEKDGDWIWQVPATAQSE